MKAGGASLYDQEDAYDPGRLSLINDIDLTDYIEMTSKGQISEDSRFIPVHADYLEEILEDTVKQSALWRKSVVAGDAPVSFVFDSLASTETKDELSRGFDKVEMGSTPRSLSRNLKKVTHHTIKNRYMLLIVNQTREKIGVMFGDKETTPGGRAIKFWSVMRIQLTNIKSEPDGLTIRVTTKKNKTFIPFRTLVMPYKYDTGFSDFLTAIETLKRLGWLTLTAKNYIITVSAGKVISVSRENITPQWEAKIINYAVKRYREANCQIPMKGQ